MSKSTYVPKRNEGSLEFLENLSAGYHITTSTPATFSASSPLSSPLYNTSSPSISSPLVQQQPILDEMAELRNNPRSFIRSRIKNQVDDCLWVDSLKQAYEELELKRANAGSFLDRCVVCTLPYGTCMHTQEWIDEAHPAFDASKDAVDRELDEMMASMGGSVVVQTSPAADDVDVYAMRWVHLEPRLSDKLGSTYHSIAAPSPRGWHSSVCIEYCAEEGTSCNKLVLVFGGFRFKKSAVPQPFGSAPRSDEVEYLSDLLVYDSVQVSWHATKPRSNAPGGRYGHAAASLEGERMLIYGGRGSSGRFLADTWIYSLASDEWISVNADVESPSPSPRVFASCVRFGQDVYLFGGTDGVDNFGDLWIFRGHPQALRWERAVAVGIPPSPRYGHQVVLLDEQEGLPVRLAIVGGCMVSPQSEVVGTSMTTSETKTMLDLGNTLQNRYQAEGNVSSLLGRGLESSISQSGGSPPRGLKDLYHKAGKIAGILHENEVKTREAEKALVEQYHLMQAGISLKMQKAKHPEALLDVLFLDIRDMIWKPQIYPKIKGDLPCSRMHFGAFSITGNLIVFGGTRPTSLGHATIETTHTRIYALDLNALIWRQIAPLESTEFLETPMRIADSDIVRAKQKVRTEKDRAKALGARGGMTVELAEAEAVLNVCNWRREALNKEMRNMGVPPPPRWGGSLTRVGCRAFYLGGWLTNTIATKDDTFLLDLEQEHERRRRDDDEFKAKLERDRKLEESRSGASAMQSAYELRAMQMMEKENEAKERRKMAIEEIISTVPPLTKPKPVVCIKANEHTMWLEWNRETTNADGQPINPNSVRYMLYMISDYEHLAVEDRVLVMPFTAWAARGDPTYFAAMTGEDESLGGGDADDVSVLSSSSMGSKSKAESQSKSTTTLLTAAESKKSKAADYSDYKGPGFPGEIIAMSSTGGRFSVAFDDGTIEGNIHRSRIRLEHRFARPFIPSTESSTDTYEDQSSNGGGDDNASTSSSKVAFMGYKLNYNNKVQGYEHLNMVNPDSYLISEKMSFVAKKRVVKKLRVRERVLKNVLRFNPLFKPISSAVSTALASYGKRQQLEASSSKSKKNASKKDLDNSESGTEDDSDINDDDDASEMTESSHRLHEVEGHEQALGSRRRRNDQNAIKSSHRKSKVEPTVKISPEWKLIYSGNACSYECGGIVPIEVLRQNPHYIVGVKFALQLHGVDFPIYELSQLSEPTMVYTKLPVMISSFSSALDALEDMDDNTLGEDDGEDLDGGGLSPSSPQNSHASASSPTATASHSRSAAKSGAAGRGGANGGNTDIPPPATFVGKSKRDLFTAVVDGKTLKMERLKDAVIGEGVGDFFL